MIHSSFYNVGLLHLHVVCYVIVPLLFSDRVQNKEVGKKGERSEWVFVYRRSCSSFMHDFSFSDAYEWIKLMYLLLHRFIFGLITWTFLILIDVRTSNTPFQQVLCTVVLCLLAHVYSITMFFFFGFLHFFLIQRGIVLFLSADPSIVEALLPEHPGSYFCGW